jgi:dipeptidyl aminopeptidase/acylaminoacyl peptidase
MSDLQTALKNNEASKETLFTPPDYLSFRLNSQGTYLSYIGTDENGVPNLFIADGINVLTAKALSFYDAPGIIQFFWSGKGDKILLLKDERGAGKLRIHLYDIHNKEISDLSEDFQNSSSLILKMHSTENKAIVGFNERNPNFHDLYLVDLDTKEKKLVLENDSFAKFLFSDELELILKIALKEDGSWDVFNAKDEIWMHLIYEEAFHVEFLSFDSKDRKVYFLDCRDSNTNQLASKSLESDLEEEFAHSHKSDIQEVLFLDGKPQAWASYYLKKEWNLLSSSLEADFLFLKQEIGAQFTFLSKSENLWLLETAEPEVGLRFYLYFRKDKKVELLNPPKKAESFSKMYPLEYTSKDGIRLTGYYTLPKEQDRGGYLKTPLPLLVIPHGGPFKFRDFYKFNPFHQWAASLGYIALSMNFRLSSGFGRELVSAGQKEYGGKAHEDVLDAVEACIRKKLTSRGSLAIFGGSYGGYEVLASLAFSPDYFSCGISICPPSNLISLLKKFPNYWEWTPYPFADNKKFFTKVDFIQNMGGDPDKPEDMEFLASCSPLYFTGQIKAPLLLVHGKNDHVVSEGESRQIFDEMKSKRKDVSYLFFPDEGHRFAKFENIIQYLDMAEKFLSKHLKGKYTPANPKILEKANGIHLS